VVHRLVALFAVDAAGGGLVTTGFLAYYLSQRYGVSVTQLPWLFFSTAGIQAVSVTIAPRLASRFGLVATMVGTHLPSNVLLAAVAFAHTFPVAVALLLARTCLSQMDVPTRQALVMTVVTPDERTKAAAATYAARYTVRPVGPLVAGAVQQLALGALLLLAGAVKGGYDLTLWRWARRERLEPRAASGQQHRHRRGRRRGRWCRMTTRSPRQPTPAGAAGLHPTTAAPRSCRRSGHGVTPRWRPCLRGHPYRWPRGDGTASHGDPFRRDPAD